MNKTLQAITISLMLTLPSAAQTASQATASRFTTPGGGVLLEEFTGIHCGYCPQGHAIAKKIMRNHDNVYTIAIHSGHFAVNHPDEPDFRIDEGEQIDTWFSPSGYPSGMINRSRLNDPSTPVISRSLWPNMARLFDQTEPPVALTANAAYDGSTSQLTIHVEGEYTATEQEPDQELNVVLTQNNLLGPQSGANMGDDYSHQNMLRLFVTPLWGDTLASPKSGERFVRDYTITLPSDIKGNKVIPADINVVAFVSCGKENIVSVTGCKPQYTNYEYPMKGVIEAPQIPIGTRYGFNFFEAYLRNLSAEDVSTATFDITLNDVSTTVEWSGNIPAGKGLDIQIPFNGLTLATKGDNIYEITLRQLNGKDVKASRLRGDFLFPLETTQEVKVQLTTSTDPYATYRLLDADGNIVREFGSSTLSEVEKIEETLTLEAGKIYCFEAKSPWGDGLLMPNAKYYLRDSNGTLLSQVLEINDFGNRSFICTSKTDGIAGIESDAKEAPFYDLMGRKTTKPGHGIYIRNGKKIIK